MLSAFLLLLPCKIENKGWRKKQTANRTHRWDPSDSRQCHEIFNSGLIDVQESSTVTDAWHGPS